MSRSVAFCTPEENPSFAIHFVAEGYIPWGPGSDGLHVQDDFGNLVQSLPQDHYWYSSVIPSHILRMWMSGPRDTQYAYH